MRPRRRLHQLGSLNQLLSPELCLPEGDGTVQPALGDCAIAESETVRESWEDLELENVEGMLKSACQAREPGGFDALGNMAAGVKFPALRGKKYNELKEQFPEVRQAFEKQRDAAKKIFEKYGFTCK